MNNYKKSIVVLLLIAGITFIIGACFSLSLVTRIAKSGIIALVFVLYLLNKRPGDLFFGIFLFSSMLIEILFHFVYYFGIFQNQVFIGVLCLVPYVGLFNHLALGTEISMVFKKYFYHVTISLVVGIFAFLKFNDFLSFHYGGFANSVLDLSFNIFVILSLLFSFFNYLSKKDNSAMMLFVASISLVLLEFFNLASYYAAGNLWIRFFRVALFLIGFYYLYRYIINNKINV